MNQLQDKAVVLLSGGMDSTTALYAAMEDSWVDQVISFNYGQRHKKELEFAAMQAELSDIHHTVIDLSQVGELLKGSALTDNIEVPHGHYAEENMKQTVVPNRNSIMLNIAVGIAVGAGVSEVWAAMHAGDHPVYPDCRPEFVSSLNQTIRLATDTNVEVIAPFIRMGKDDIVRIGTELGVRYEFTWSCYEGGEVHCGRCGTCVERAEAFWLALVDDPTVYADKDYWRAVTGK